MNHFDFWKKWGSHTDANEFANAWVALGLLSTVMKSLEPLPNDSNYTFENEALPKGFVQDLEKRICRIIRASKRGAPLPWNFPSPLQKVKIGGKSVSLAGIDPNLLADVWSKTAIRPQGPVKLSVMNYPRTEPVNRWFRLLFKANPNISAAYLNMEEPYSEVQLNWPLRLGYFANNPVEHVIHETALEWPSKELAKPVIINRDNANCDVLVCDGNFNQLIQTVLDLPVPLKCNLFILRGPVEEQSAGLDHLLSAFIEQTHANGFVFINPETREKDFVTGMNRFITFLSHNQSFDLAISQAFTHEIASDPLIFMSNRLAGYSIRNMVVKLKTTLLEMPSEFVMDIVPNSIQRMNLPMHVPSLDGIMTGDTKILDRTFDRVAKLMSFDHESGGATELAFLNTACKAIIPDKTTLEKMSARFVQSRMFIQKDGKYVEEKIALVKDIPSRIRIRIGPPEGEWTSLHDAEFPVEKLPKYLESWRLTVVLSEPNHLQKPLVGEVRLPRNGPSTECDFSFTPTGDDPFEGRITVLHRGRVIQTCIMKVNVARSSLTVKADGKIEMTERIPVYSNTGELESRRQFDLAFVENHSSGNQPRVTAISGKHAWLKNLTDCEEAVKDINAALTNVAMSVNDYSGGLESEEGRKLLVELAQQGCFLYGFIVRDQLEGQSGTYDASKKEYIQIVSTRPESVIPFEFIYDHKAPDDEATLCPSWKEALANGKCQDTCKANKSEYVCPLGFWGLSKVIERHIYSPGLDPENKDYYLQTEPVKGRSTLLLGGPFLVGASNRVDQAILDNLIKACEAKLGSPSNKAKDWKAWAKIVKSTSPALILALPHTEGAGSMMALEIGGKKKKSIQIDRDFVRVAESSTYPLVALLGCDTTGTAQDYGSYVSQFRREGAAVVIGTIATVFGGHAVQVAEMLISGLTQTSRKNERIGEVIRSVKREALQKGLLMALCIVAFGDSDWKLNKP